MRVPHRIADFDQNNAESLRRIWFVGDVHAQFKYLAQSLQAAEVRPRWIVFAGDIDIDHKPFREILEPLKRVDANMRVAFIHGNHDADSHEHWAMLHDCGDAVPIHGQVVELDGVRVAGLGGHFVGRVWMPPAVPVYFDKEAATSRDATEFRGGQRPSPVYHGAIYPQDVDRLTRMQADILVTHEAPSCHQNGFVALDELARSLGVARSFHGHHHDDRTAQYALQREQLGFDAIALQYCAIKNGLGEVIFGGEPGW